MAGHERSLRVLADNERHQMAECGRLAVEQAEDERTERARADDRRREAELEALCLSAL